MEWVAAALWGLAGAAGRTLPGRSALHVRKDPAGSAFAHLTAAAA
ncbi:hypothetical protein [Streptomyces sp. NPDC054962]